MAADLPPRLSEQQQFILASLVLDAERHRRTYEGRLHAIPYRGEIVERLSRSVALEFDTDGDRISAPPLPAGERAARLVERGFSADQAWRFVRRKRAPMARDRHVTESHSSSFSRALDRLQERGLITARYGDGRAHDRRVRVSLTDDGREAGEEILRRHRDGRYSLAFDTLD